MSFFFLPDLRSLIILHWQLKSLDKKLAKGESLDGCDGGVPATAEDIKKEKIAVALTYGTGNAVSSVALSSGCSGDSGANTPRSQVSLMTAPPSARSEIGGHTASINEAPPAPSPRGGAKSPVLSEGRPVRTRKATPAAAALLASAQAARERQIRGKETKETAKGSKKSVESDTETKVGRSRRALNRKEKYSQPQVQVKKTRQGRRKPAIPTPPDDDPKASDCEDPFDDTAEDGMDPAPIMDDNGGFHHISSQLDEGVSPSTRPPDAILAAAVRERLSQSRSDMAPMGNILADALGMVRVPLHPPAHSLYSFVPFHSGTRVRCWPLGPSTPTWRSPRRSPPQSVPLAREPHPSSFPRFIWQWPRRQSWST
mmetsp:Transcript_60172/g.159960  ORF Transcript_60172/g.159960 Transcript_60172/m.159960 type:complete len:370 (+) Transcript_60172:590-1699(+)